MTLQELIDETGHIGDTSNDDIIRQHVFLREALKDAVFFINSILKDAPTTIRGWKDLTAKPDAAEAQEHGYEICHWQFSERAKKVLQWRDYVKSTRKEEVESHE